MEDFVAALPEEVTTKILVPNCEDPQFEQFGLSLEPGHPDALDLSKDGVRSQLMSLVKRFGFVEVKMHPEGPEKPEGGWVWGKIPSREPHACLPHTDKVQAHFGATVMLSSPDLKKGRRSTLLVPLPTALRAMGTHWNHHVPGYYEVMARMARIKNRLASGLVFSTSELETDIDVLTTIRESISPSAHEDTQTWRFIHAVRKDLVLGKTAAVNYTWEPGRMLLISDTICHARGRESEGPSQDDELLVDDI